MTQYYEILKAEFHLPDAELLFKIACMEYEKRENRGIMCFVEKDKIVSYRTLIEFSESSIDAEGFVDENKDSIRKLLEMSKPSFEGDKSRCILFRTSETKPCWGIILEERIEEADWPIIYFGGTGKWEMKYKKQVVIRSDYNHFSFDSQSKEKTLKDQLPEKLRKNKYFPPLIQCLEKQRHGALVIIAEDAEDETKRLCDLYKRGTRIEPFSLEYDYAFNIISGFCSVDEAIFIDFGGQCHGYGVILDGVAKSIGKRGKGSRYNSALNYITETNRCAIVVSEDKGKGIHILPEKDGEIK